MKDLISRESVERMIKNTFADYQWEYDSLLRKLENIPTVEAVPLSVIEKIKAEIIQYFMQNKESEDLFLAGCGDGAYHALAIIDKAVKECTHE